jgi:hypothetical protein
LECGVIVALKILNHIWKRANSSHEL